MVEQVQAITGSGSRAAITLREIFESGRPLTYIRSAEEQRVERLLREVSFSLSGSTILPVWTWSLTEGIRQDGKEAEAGTASPRAALDFIASHDGAGRS